MPWATGVIDIEMNVIKWDWKRRIPQKMIAGGSRKSPSVKVLYGGDEVRIGMNGKGDDSTLDEEERGWEGWGITGYVMSRQDQ